MRKPTLVGALLGAACCLTLLFAAPAGAATVTFQDGTLADAQWTTAVETLFGGGTANAYQVAAGGNPTAYRRLDITLNSAAGTGNNNTVFAFEAFAGAVHDPSTGGPILAVDYREDSLRIGAYVQACGLAVRQGGVIYYGPSFLTPSAAGTWVTTTQSALVAAQFHTLASAGQHPDFSLTGAPLEFGCYRANSTGTGSFGYTTGGGIDNWRVDLAVDAAVATETTSWGGLKARFRDGSGAE